MYHRVPLRVEGGSGRCHVVCLSKASATSDGTDTFTKAERAQSDEGALPCVGL